MSEQKAKLFKAIIQEVTKWDMDLSEITIRKSICFDNLFSHVSHLGALNLEI